MDPVQGYAGIRNHSEHTIECDNCIPEWIPQLDNVNHYMLPDDKLCTFFDEHEGQVIFRYGYNEYSGELYVSTKKHRSNIFLQSEELFYIYVLHLNQSITHFYYI